MMKYLIVFALVFGFLLAGCTAPNSAEKPVAEQTPTIEPNKSVEVEPPLLGNDSDEHGCKASAGYSWCEPLKKCIRPWETECKAEEPITPMVGNDSDEHGCKASAGYVWCEPMNECIRPWETECKSGEMVGNDSDEHGCIGSAGYVWCEPMNECIRPWETECTAEEESA